MGRNGYGFDFDIFLFSLRKPAITDLMQRRFGMEEVGYFSHWIFSNVTSHPRSRMKTYEWKLDPGHLDDCDTCYDVGHGVIQIGITPHPHELAGTCTDRYGKKLEIMLDAQAQERIASGEWRIWQRAPRDLLQYSQGKPLFITSVRNCLDYVSPEDIDPRTERKSFEAAQSFLQFLHGKYGGVIIDDDLKVPNLKALVPQRLSELDEVMQSYSWETEEFEPEIVQFPAR